MLSETIRKKFISLFNTNPLMVRSPVHLELIGRHTFMFGGMMISAAIDKEIICAISPNYSDICQIHAFNFRDGENFNLNKYSHSKKSWLNDIQDVVHQFQKQKLEIKGFDCVFGADIPEDSGLSVPSALIGAITFGLNLQFNHGLQKADMVKIAMETSPKDKSPTANRNEYYPGIFGKTNQVLLLESSMTEPRYIDFPMNEFRLVLCCASHSRPDSVDESESVNQEIKSAFSILKKHYQPIQSLADVRMDQLVKHQSDLQPQVLDRLKFLVEEMKRTRECEESLRKGDVTTFGKIMFESYRGLRQLPGSDNGTLDVLVEKAVSSGYAVGANMYSNGKSNGVVNLIKVENVDAFSKFMKETCKKEADLTVNTYAVKIVNGASKL